MHQLMLTGLPFRLSCVCNQNAVYEKTGEYYHKRDGDASQIFDNFCLSYLFDSARIFFSHYFILPPCVESENMV